MGYLLDTPTLAEVLRSAPSRAFVRRLAGTASRDRWTSVITVGQLLVAARRAQQPRLMQNVVNLVAGVRVAPFDVAAAQAFAKLRAAAGIELKGEDVMIAAIALTNSFTLVTTRDEEFGALPNLRVENWIG